jgi:hypothetical protein
MASLYATIRHLIEGSFQVSGDLTKTTERIPIIGQQQYGAGSAAQQGDQWLADKRTLAGASETINLESTLKNAFGDTITFTKLRELWIFNTATTAGHLLTLTGGFLGVMIGGTDPAPTIAPLGWYIRSSPIDGYAISEGKTSITIDPGANTITYWLILLGVKA